MASRAAAMMTAPNKQTAKKKTATKKTATKQTATKRTATKQTATKQTATKKTATKKTATKKSATKQPSSSSSTRAAPRFTPAARRFLQELARRQDRAWFLPRKEEFKALLEEPMRSLLAAIGPLLLDAFPAVEDALPKVFRIYRDTRFSKDKRPFKENISGQLSLGRVGFYVHVSADEVFAAVGAWQMEPEVLQVYRKNLVDNAAVGDALLAETRALETRGFKLMSFDELARAPAGVSPAHPRIQLLKHKGWAVALPPDGLDADSDGFVAALVARVLQTKTAAGLLARALTP